MKTVDELDPKSREFYERARFKLALSLIFAAIVSPRTIFHAFRRCALAAAPQLGPWPRRRLCVPFRRPPARTPLADARITPPLLLFTLRP